MMVLVTATHILVVVGDQFWQVILSCVLSLVRRFNHLIFLGGEGAQLTVKVAELR